MALETPAPGRIDRGLAEDRDEIEVPRVVRGIQVLLQPVDQPDVFLFLEALGAEQEGEHLHDGLALFLGKLAQGNPRAFRPVGEEVPDVAGLVPEFIGRGALVFGIEGSEQLGGRLGHGGSGLVVLGPGHEGRGEDQARKQEAGRRGTKKSGKGGFHLFTMGAHEGAPRKPILGKGCGLKPLRRTF